MHKMDTRRFKIKPNGKIDKFLEIVIYVLLVLFIWIVIIGPSFENMPYRDDDPYYIDR